MATNKSNTYPLSIFLQKIQVTTHKKKKIVAKFSWKLACVVFYVLEIIGTDSYLYEFFFLP